MASELPIEELQKGVEAITWQRAVASLALLSGSIVFAKLAGHFVRRVFSRGARGPAFAFSKLLAYGLMFSGAVTALAHLGLPLSSLVLTSSALLVGVGFSLQHVTRDAVAGVVILVEQSIRQNDFVEFAGTMGTVQQIGLRATQLLTREGTVLVVPNHRLVTSEVVNHSYPLPRTRVRVEIPIDARQALDEAREALLDVAARHAEVLADPPPVVRLDGIEQWGFRLLLIAWVADAVVARRVASELRFATADAFAASGIRFPTPSLTLTLPADPRTDSDGRRSPEHEPAH
ncbi:MAG TPA: mechanosensitive ion channel domain-containing protein [Polyangia bacterium]|nr:mechanosensitive ion channel domain-containing protein [Polyangia bacterium]